MISKSTAKRLAVQRGDMVRVVETWRLPSLTNEAIHTIKIDEREPFIYRVNVRTRNPCNGSQGNTVLGRIMRGKAKKQQRAAAHSALSEYGFARDCPTDDRIGRIDLGCPLCALNETGLTITVTRIAPSNGLDPHDGLGAALKGVIDGTADWLGLKNDRDPRVTWVLDQRRGKKGEYAVEIKIEPRRQS